ncbi:hypothetical protein CONCODRAFT_73490 [Conidiobolus coronatus NRRL 28638]|uniref:Peptidase S9A N-terminal domain-containing protein n=1 Tax=Conidiobolus coronatus (strain ATCC 28846 / CBS 209.66 / NRRL 28638) TaxID=796925 RepID=A0A137NVE7_CONC2|nr:hypothetical protein CONCODRAFT_73490 [Conidiobolus coronatus NRRL 28638]|eukprot:KXN66722.1 hypothetical protein CONCODRAFT_73490 [Conidiobolus coronatus NRRL 28638]
MIVNNFIQLTLLSLLTKAQVTNFGSEDGLTEVRKRVAEWEYPVAPRDESATDTYWGKTVQDPYRPLKSLLDPKTLKIIDESNQFTKKVLDLDVTRSSVRNDLERMSAYERTSLTANVNGTIYQLYNPGTYTQSILTRQRTTVLVKLLLKIFTKNFVDE